MKMRKPILIVTAMAAILTESTGANAAKLHHTSSMAGLALAATASRRI
jgi:hypothetical protein